MSGGGDRAAADLLTFARQLHDWGAAVTAIKPGTKRPGHKWERWQTQPQTRSELDGLPWRGATAVGVVNGSGDFRIFDIDAAKDSAGRPVAPVPERVVIELLTALGLHDDYQWSYRSGSGAGYGVVIRCAEALPLDRTATRGVYVGRPKDGRNFGQLELRWATGQTVIDGAHPAGPGYRWRRGERPFLPPALRTAAQVVAAFTAIADLAPAVAPASTANGRGTTATNPAKPSATDKYAAAALADARRQVATATPGGRNNALFRQTAALAELVNGGVLRRVDVERAMTGAALAAGLPPTETAATIGSAFQKAGATARTPMPSANGHGPTKSDNRVRSDVLGHMMQSTNGRPPGGAATEAVTGPPPGDVLIPRPMPLADLLQREFAPLVFLVDGILAKGHLAMLGGRPKSGKTWLLLQLAQAVDTGRPFLGRTTRRGRVLYVALEDGERRISQRCRLLKWQPEQAAVLFTIARIDGDMGAGPGVAQLAQLAADFDLIIVDTLIAALSGRANENDNAQMGEIMNALAQIAHDSDTAVLLNHHTGKGIAEDVFNLLRGASALRGGYDVGMVLDRKRGEREAVLHMESRDVDLSELTIRQAESGAGWECLGDGNRIKTIRAGRAVVEAMTLHGDGMSADQLAALMDKAKATIYEQLRLAERDGLVRRQVGKSDNGRPPDIWFLSDTEGVTL